MVQDVTVAPQLNEQMKCRQSIIIQQARQAVASKKIAEITEKIDSMKIELDLWRQVSSNCALNILNLNQMLKNMAD